MVHVMTKQEFKSKVLQDQARRRREKIQAEKDKYRDADQHIFDNHLRIERNMRRYGKNGHKVYDK